jgi:hypothetical protein
MNIQEKKVWFEKKNAAPCVLPKNCFSTCVAQKHFLLVRPSTRLNRSFPNPM